MCRTSDVESIHDNILLIKIVCLFVIIVSVFAVCSLFVVFCVHRAISNLYSLMGKFGIRDRGEVRATATFEQLDKVRLLSIIS